MNLLPMKQKAPRWAQSAFPYVESLLVVCLMAAVNLSNRVFVEGGARYTLLLIGVAYGVWRGGKGPALLALLVSCLLGAYVFSPPSFSMHIASRSDEVALLLYMVVGVVIVCLGEAQHATHRRLLEKEAELKQAYARLAEAHASVKDVAERKAADLEELRRFIAEEV